MSSKKYPSIVIDRSKNSTYPYDFIIVLDNEVGFISRAFLIKDEDSYCEYKATRALHNSNGTPTYTFHKLKSGAIILTIEEFLHDFEVNNNAKKRIETLLKKAMKRYVHGEKSLTPHGDCGIDNQILLMSETILRAKANREELVRRSYSPDQADYNITLAEATLKTLENVRDGIM